MNEKEQVCARYAALSGSPVLVRREAASPLSKAVEKEKPARGMVRTGLGILKQGAVFKA